MTKMVKSSREIAATQIPPYGSKFAAFTPNLKSFAPSITQLQRPLRLVPDAMRPAVKPHEFSSIDLASWNFGHRPICA